ncbi:hypothetical protein ANCDUO_14651 [Ancylostoma duodenale]|uniref:Uncharacterized protein n=1 Tax=Ancylostoma duodenale TaxID=51022 RepID=A0A0C2GDL2_9BILA|nr:hypothetical protein ANCDUO_14651 [Ancylostoma duodenale]
MGGLKKKKNVVLRYHWAYGTSATTRIIPGVTYLEAIAISRLASLHGRLGECQIHGKFRSRSFLSIGNHLQAKAGGVAPHMINMGVRPAPAAIQATAGVPPQIAQEVEQRMLIKEP